VWVKISPFGERDRVRGIFSGLSEVLYKTSDSGVPKSANGRLWGVGGGGQLTNLK